MRVRIRTVVIAFAVAMTVGFVGSRALHEGGYVDESYTPPWSTGSR